MTIRRFIIQSFQNLDDKGKRFVRKMYGDKIGGYDCEKLFQLEFCRDVIYDVIELLTNNLLPFNQPLINETHYKNGILNTDTSKFYMRDPDIHYISEYINKTVVESTTELKKIPEKNMMDEDEEYEEEEYEEEEEEEKEIKKPEIRKMCKLFKK
jgi:hypothetical protein